MQSHKSVRTFKAAIGFAAATIVALGVTGCGGGSDATTVNTNTDQQQAQVLVQQGQTQLNALLTRTTPVTASDIAAVRSQFAAAVSHDSSNRQAAFGFGLLDLAYYAQTLAETTTRAQQPGRAVPASLSSLTTLLKNANPLTGNGKVDLANLGNLLIRATATAPLLGIQTRQEVPSSTELAQIRAGIQFVRDALNADIPRIEQGNAAGFSFVVATPEAGNPSATTTIDQADITAMLGLLRGLRAVTNLALAYDTNYGNYDTIGTQRISSYFGTLAVGQTVTPDQYLPAAPFGTLASDGAASIVNAKTDISTGLDLLAGFQNVAQQRGSATGHLIDLSDFTTEDLSQFTQGVTQARAALSNPVVLDNRVIDLNAFFSNPPPSLRVFFPNYTVEQDAGSLYLHATSLPSPNFGGVYTGMGLGLTTDTRVFTDETVSDLISEVRLTQRTTF